jgi:hypothetical protein
VLCGWRQDLQKDTSIDCKLEEDFDIIVPLVRLGYLAKGYVMGNVGRYYWHARYHQSSVLRAAFGSEDRAMIGQRYE